MLYSRARPAEPTQPLPPTPATADAKQAADPLETKLQALAKLRQPDSDQAILQPSPAQSEPLMSDDAAPGRLAALRDFIRDQVERHWSLNLASLEQNEFSIPIRIQITGSGTVLKAEIIDTARSADPVYHEIASSARNAVLLGVAVLAAAGALSECDGAGVISQSQRDFALAQAGEGSGYGRSRATRKPAKPE